MGISGLTTFMKNNPQLAKEFPLQSTKVVIDGNSLYHFIFYYNQVDSLHGGDYDHYALKSESFLASFTPATSNHMLFLTVEMSQMA